MEGATDDNESNSAQKLSTTNLKNNSKGRKVGRRTIGSANEKQLASDDAMIIRRRSDSSQSSNIFGFFYIFLYLISGKMLTFFI